MRRAWLGLIFFAATAAYAAPTQVVQTRVSGFRELGAAFKAVNDGLRSKQPQTILIQQSARQIRNAANQMHGWFPAGSGPEAGVKTAARGEIWSQPGKFKSEQDKFIAAAAKLQAATNSGDLNLLRKEARSLGATCKSCHDSFRVPSS